jgi:HJR/Mrr/RecB family endonuclease
MKNQKNGFDIFIEKTYLFLKNKLNLDDIQAIVITASLVLLPITYFFGIGYTQINELRIAFFITVGLDVLTIIYSIVKAKYFENKRIYFIKEFDKKIQESKQIIVKSLNDVNNLTPYEFELFVKEFFIQKGYDAINTQMSHDHGADVIAIKDSVKYVIQAKLYSKPLSSYVVDRVNYAKRRYLADKSIIITNNDVTNQTLLYAADQGVELIRGQEIEHYLMKNNSIIINKKSI